MGGTSGPCCITCICSNMQEMQEMQEMTSDLLTAQQVQRLLRVDKSTVYRMASDGRLPAVKVGKQWRFQASDIEKLVGGRTPQLEGSLTLNGASAQSVVDVMAERLGVMMVVTDLDGRPVTRIANTCEWFDERDHDPTVIDACIAEWRDLGADVDLSPRLRRGGLGFECARAFIRHDNQLVGMVLAGGISPFGQESPVLHNLDDAARQRLVETLPMVAALIDRCAVRTSDLNNTRSMT